jgi:hypothetical protein
LTVPKRCWCELRYLHEPSQLLARDDGASNVIIQTLELRKDLEISRMLPRSDVESVHIHLLSRRLCECKTKGCADDRDDHGEKDESDCCADNECGDSE